MPSSAPAAPVCPPRRKAGRNETAAIDDPVRLYLLQMGGIPLLDRDAEVASSRRIEHWRWRFRRELLSNDLVLQTAVRLLERVQAGTIRLDRTLEVAVTNTDEKRQLLKRLEPNLKTLHRLIAENRQLFREATSKSTPVAVRRRTWRRLVRQRNKAVRLVEEMRLRIQRLDPLLKQLRGLASRLKQVDRQSQRRLLIGMGESRRTLARRLERLATYERQYDAAKRELAAG
ncbi:MAG: sigma-70 factor domain-containing protein, partial [Pirellulales bacterium]